MLIQSLNETLWRLSEYSSPFLMWPLWWETPPPLLSGRKGCHIMWHKRGDCWKILMTIGISSRLDAQKNIATNSSNKRCCSTTDHCWSAKTKREEIQRSSGGTAATNGHGSSSSKSQQFMKWDREFLTRIECQIPLLFIFCSMLCVS